MTTVTPTRTLAFDRLKLCVVLLVILHHAVLAYIRLGHFDTLHYLNSTAPIVDSARWIGFDVIVDFNDIWFMSLMFFISGLFVLHGLRRRGAARYFASRLLRLGLPFAVAAFALMPLAFYPSVLQTGNHPSFPVFWLATIERPAWSAGPAWFIAVLLAMDAIAALAWYARPRPMGRTASIPDFVARRPILCLSLALAAATAVYLPMLAAFGASYWFARGPFSVQASRALLYGLMFALGVGLGAAGPQHPLFANPGPFTRFAPIAAVLGLLLFAGLLTLQIESLHQPGRIPSLLPGTILVLDCVLLCLAVTGCFLRLPPASTSLDRLTPFAFGLYLLHYPPMTWIQSSLLDAPLPAIAKAALAFFATLLASLALVALLRRSRMLRRVL